MRRLPLGLLALVFLLGATAAACAQSAPQAAPPVASLPFDYYVMTLSWAPGFCDLGGGETSSPECEQGSGQGFVVHGLWPDNEYRPNPEACPGQDASPEDLSQAHGVYPNDRLAAYEYRKHGACTGLSANEYFATVRQVRSRLNIPPVLQSPHDKQSFAPDELQKAIIAVNPNLRPDNMAITCSNGELVDVRFCIARDLSSYANCRKVARHSCQRASLMVAPVR
jgi:ribonuclease T2